MLTGASQTKSAVASCGAVFIRYTSTSTDVVLFWCDFVAEEAVASVLASSRKTEVAVAGKPTVSVVSASRAALRQGGAEAEDSCG